MVLLVQLVRYVLVVQWPDHKNLIVIQVSQEAKHWRVTIRIICALPTTDQLIKCTLSTRDVMYMPAVRNCVCVGPLVLSTQTALLLPSKRPTSLLPSKRPTSPLPSKRPTSLLPSKRPTSLLPSKRPASLARLSDDRHSHTL